MNKIQGLSENISINVEEVDKIYTTKDYAKFSFLAGNRMVNRRTVSQLIASMQEEQLEIPIVVNGDLKIIDGQHRFLAQKELGLPIYFTIKREYGISQIRRANTIGTTWRKSDHLNLHVQDGKEDYLYIEDLVKNYNLSLHEILTIIARATEKKKTYITTVFESGDLKIEEKEREAIKSFLMSFAILRNFLDKRRLSKCIQAYLELFFIEKPFEFDIEHFHRKLQKFGGALTYARDKRDMLSTICNKIYSIGERTDNNKILYDPLAGKFYR
ncbi:MAG: ParB N-terminal domain-containing protein [Peptostreptococcaceae bacterium]